MNKAFLFFSIAGFLIGLCGAMLLTWRWAKQHLPPGEWRSYMKLALSIQLIVLLSLIVIQLALLLIRR
jgi:hypothetical protein